MASFAPRPMPSTGFRQTDPNRGRTGGFMPPTGGWGGGPPSLPMEKMQPQIDPQITEMPQTNRMIPPMGMPPNGGIMKPPMSMPPPPMNMPPPQASGGFGAPPMPGIPQMPKPMPAPQQMGRRPNPRRRF